MSEDLTWMEVPFHDQHRTDTEKTRRTPMVTTLKTHPTVHICFTWPRPQVKDNLLEMRIHIYMHSKIKDLRSGGGTNTTLENRIRAFLQERKDFYTPAKMDEKINED